MERRVQYKTNGNAQAASATALHRIANGKWDRLLEIIPPPNN